jgi:major type 1 subunit fimbrin (pilin)
MNKVALGLIIAAAVGCSASTFAATNGEGQINFTGEIIDSACQVVNGLSNPLNVQLGKVSKTVFTGAGSTSTLTKFDIQLTNCPETVTSAAINFGGTPDANNNATLALTPDAMRQPVWRFSWLMPQSSLSACIRHRSSIN